MKSNKHSSTEDAVGKLHSTITGLFQRKLDRMIDVCEGVDGEIEDPMFVIDTRDLNAAAKWVGQNEIGVLEAQADETSELSKSLKKIKDKHSGKVVQFSDVAEG